MNERSPYLQVWREVRVSFCKIVIVSFLTDRYRSDGLYYTMAGTPSSPTQSFIRVEIEMVDRHCGDHEALFSGPSARALPAVGRAHDHVRGPICMRLHRARCHAMQLRVT